MVGVKIESLVVDRAENTNELTPLPKKKGDSFLQVPLERKEVFFAGTPQK